MKLIFGEEEYFVFNGQNVSDPVKLKNSLLQASSIVCVIDCENLICRDQFIAAVHRAIRSSKTGVAISKILGIEIMLQLTGTHQVKIALDRFDVSNDTTDIIVLQDSPDPRSSSLLPGFPLINLRHEIIEKYFDDPPKDPCSSVISLGVRMVVDHE